jgi:tRNA A-37 threonylcarbamoyl transferase component Bud32/phage FluMu protein Com
VAETAVGSIQIKCPSCGFVNERPNRGPLHPFTCSKCNKILIIPGKIGDIQVSELLGTGGMGAVYKGIDTLLQRQIAVKLMKKSADGKAQQTNEQYIQEARSQAKVNHPNVAQVFSAGMHNDAPFIVMELIEGGMLSQLFTAEKPMPELQAVEFAVQIAKGLQAAYNAGITHRDIKPSNVLLDKSGQSKIVDFGLAGSVEGEETTGVGTAAYIAPENLRKASANQPRPDHRADMYSLGVTLYELVTGQQPFKGKDIKEKIEARFKGPPKNICLINDQLHLETAALINRLLKNDPTQRYATYEELIKDIEEVKAAVAAGPANVDIFSIPAEDGGATVDPTSLALASATGLSAGRAAKGKIKPPAINTKTLITVGVIVLAILVLVGIIVGVLSMGPKKPTTGNNPPPAVVVVPPPTENPVPPVEPPKVEPPIVEPPKVEPPKVEPPNVEPPKVEPPKVEPPKPVPPKVEPPKVAPPKVDPPKVEPPKPAPPKVEPPKVEPAKTAKITLIQKGKPVQPEMFSKTQDSWNTVGGALANKDAKPLIIHKLPDGDFKIAMTLIITGKNTSTITFGNQGRLGFVSRIPPPRIYTTGRYGRSGDAKDINEQTPGTPTADLIAPGKPFDLEIVRNGKSIAVYIEGKTETRKQVLIGGYPEGPFGNITITPGTAGADGLKITEMTFEPIAPDPKEP